MLTLRPHPRRLNQRLLAVEPNNQSSINPFRLESYCATQQVGNINNHVGRKCLLHWYSKAAFSEPLLGAWPYAKLFACLVGRAGGGGSMFTASVLQRRKLSLSGVKYTPWGWPARTRETKDGNPDLPDSKVCSVSICGNIYAGDKGQRSGGTTCLGLPSDSDSSSSSSSSSSLLSSSLSSSLAIFCRALLNTDCKTMESS